MPTSQYLYAHTRSWRIRYRTHDGLVRHAYVLLPAWYGPHRHPRIPLVISPHGRGVQARSNARLWGGLPALGRFAVVNPEGQGRHLRLLSWGYAGQIDDLARMPEIVRRALPWLRIDRRRIYAFGGSMGGQEVLLLAVRHPRLLAGVAAFDASTDLRARYYAFARIRCWPRCPGGGRAGARLQALAREEVGGSPRRRFSAYAARSPVTYAGALARSRVPLQLWWSVSDGVVVDGRSQSGRLYRRIHRANPSAPVVEFVGRWMHSEDMRYTGKLRIALARFGLLRARDVAGTCGMVRGPRNTLERIAPDVRPPFACLMFQPKPQPQPKPKPRPKPKPAPKPEPEPSGRPWPSPRAPPPAPPAEPYTPSPPAPGGEPMTDGSVTGA